MSASVREKRKQLSTSSSSGCCTSPDCSDSKRRQERKKQRQDSVELNSSANESMELQETLEEIRQQLANVATKADIQDLRDEMNRITTRLDYRMQQLESTVLELQLQKDVLTAEVRTLKENKELCDKVAQCQKEDSSIRRDLNDMEQHDRQFNVRVYRVAEAKGGLKPSTTA